MRLIIVNQKIATIIAAACFAFLSGCTTVLVSPYDEKLVTDTEAFYKKAAEMIEKGRSVSPLTDAERKKIRNPSAHEGYYTKFEGKYNDLIIDTEALILRAMASDNKISATGQALQSKISEIIENTIPSKCSELSAEFSSTSLTAKNYVDLNDKLTDNTKILKKANWEGRKLIVFNAVLAIQKAEGFKKQVKKLEEAK